MSAQFTRRRFSLGALLAASACAPGQAPSLSNWLRIAVTLEPPNLDPTQGAAAATDEIVYANVFEGLTRINRDGAVEPALARNWEIGAGGRSYAFELAQGVVFHNGEPCDAEAVKFSLDRARAPDSINAQRQLFESISAVSVLGPHAIRIDLQRPSSDFLFNLGWGDAVIVSPSSVMTNAVTPIGTGPFRFSRWARGVFVDLVRNDAYWGEKAKIEGARFSFIPDAPIAYAALMADDVDGVPDFTAPELLPQIQRDRRFRIAIGASEGETILAINNGRGPLSDIRVRRALAHAIDRRAIIDGAMFGYGTPIGSHFAPTHPAYVDLTARYPFDPARARALLVEAGAAGMRLTLKLPPPPYARRGGEIIAAQLRAVGVDARIEAVEWAPWLEQVFGAKDYDLTIVSHTEPLDIGVYARDDYYFDYHSDAFKRVMDAYARATSEDERVASLQAAQRQIAEDCVNVFLFQFPKIGVWRKGVEGVAINAPIQANDLTRARWVRA